MTVQLANANVVIVAKQFNPSIMSQIWLVDNGLVNRDEFGRGCIFTEMIANVTTDKFVLFAAPEQLQFTPTGDQQNHGELVRSVLGRLVKILPHTPYTAVGMNFTWHVNPVEGSFSDFSRALFFDRSRPLFRAFDADDARFGGYLSRNELGCRLKLDVKPMKVTDNDETVEFMQFAFNYHRDVSRDESGVDVIVNLLNQWEEARDLTSRTMQTLGKGNDE